MNSMEILKFPYGMCDAVQQWNLHVENWLLGTQWLPYPHYACMVRVEEENKMFMKRNEKGLKLILAKVVDEFMTTVGTD